MILYLKRYRNTEIPPILTTINSLLFFIIFTGSAQASTVTWNLTDLSFFKGSNATGWFTYDSSIADLSHAITDWNIVVTYPSYPTVPSPLNPNVALSNPIIFDSGPFNLASLKTAIPGVYFASDSETDVYDGKEYHTRCYLMLDFLISGTAADELADPSNC
jgi:hypothetical protein